MTEARGKTGSMTARVLDMLLNLLSKTSQLLAFFLALGFGGLLDTDSVQAGSILAEIEHRYPCYLPSSERRLELEFGSNDDSAVQLEYFLDEPVLSINDRLAFEQPDEVVLFEYFVACELARRTNLRMFEDIHNDVQRAERLLREVDCRAISDLQRHGVIRKFEQLATLIDYYQFRKGDDGYLGVPFWLRAENIERNCPT